MRTPGVLALLICTGALVAACGGGGGGDRDYRAPSPPAAPAPRAEPLLFGYYGTQPGTAQETRDHTNVVLVANWGDEQSIINQALNDLALYDKAIVSVDAFVYLHGDPHPDRDARLRRLLEALKQAGYLEKIVAFYPIDEPNQAGVSDAEATQVNADVRRIAAEYGIAPKLAVIYGPNNAELPGIGSYDWVGQDDYDKGPAQLAWYDRLQLRADQRLILVPGGASPWKQDLAPFIAYAQAHPNVAAIITFIWFDQWGDSGQLGVRSNGMAEQYRAFGKHLL